MSNIVEYVRWRGDFSFEQSPFNIIDNLVLSHLTYLDMTEVFKDTSEITIEDIYERMKDDIRFRLLNYGEEDCKLLKECAASKRFSKVKVSRYVDDIRVQDNIQFAAMLFYVNENIKVVAYRGTDNTIVGWKEDFMMSYCRIPAQQQALQYLHEVLKDIDKVYVLGHSKGANLAMYATAHLSEDELDKIEKVYLNDGPGFCQQVLDASLIEKIDDKCVRITPEFCVVGAIFEPKITEEYIVKSSASQMMQHGMLSWQVIGEGLELAEAHDPYSEGINSVFDRFVEKMDNLQDRQAFVDSIFDTMGENGAVTIEDFTKEGPAAMENLFMNVLGENAEGLNPLRSVKDNVVKDIKDFSLGRLIKDKEERKPIIRIGLCILAFVLCYLIPENFIEVAFAVVIFAVVAYQISFTLYRLYKSKWDFHKEKLRVNISIILIVSYTILMVKDHALILVASVLLGIFFLTSAYHCFLQFMDGKGNRGTRARYFFETILSASCGGYLMLAPEVDMSWYTMTLGSYALIDAIFEIIKLYRRYKTNS
ncbi:MAG: DUF2974 domain-containing protein [Lachnospiraceae bacterium]|nr:DUF2974 domain-containing protein [Lachnospiraceae bacterium]